MTNNIGYVHPYFEYFTEHKIEAKDVLRGDYFSSFGLIFQIVGPTFTRGVTSDIVYRRVDELRDAQVTGHGAMYAQVDADLPVTVYRNPAEAPA